MHGTTRNPYLMTLPSLISAKNKLSQIAENYDPNRYSLKGFDSEKLTPTQFRQQLMRNFRINITDEELGALIYLFDSDGEQTVDSMEFITEFFRLGKLERKKVIKEKRERVMRIERMKQMEEEKRLRAAKASIDAQVAENWTPEDENSAIKKLTRAAFCYDATRGGLEAFIKFEYLDAAEFREQMKSNLETKLTIEETAALINLFGDLDEKIVFCREFLNNFFRIRRIELDKHSRSQRAITEERHLQQAHRLEEVIEKYSKLTVAKIEPFTEEDKASAVDKIRTAAAFRRPNPFINAIEKSFEAAELTHTAFKELLKNNFYVQLTPAELDALVSMFDRNQDGTISCPEFMRTFFRIGFDEHAHMLQEKRERAAYLRRKEIERVEKRVQSAVALVRTKVVWPELPPIEGDAYGGTSSPDTQTFSTSGSNMSTSTTLKKRKTKRLTVSALLSPNKLAQRLANSDTSLTKLFPKASDDTKDFILQIEEQDRLISKMKLTGRSSSSGHSSHNNAAMTHSHSKKKITHHSSSSSSSSSHQDRQEQYHEDDLDEVEFVPPPQDMQSGQDRPRTVHSSCKQRQDEDEDDYNMTQEPDEFNYTGMHFDEVEEVADS
mmetsp:Transcript_9123/g.12612  ORF Transcript_9123/g.12612 Transcript_9123/m.12612 type:complete len:608 (+) Transcript_9123:32-1855(+)|eukprot:CAMPEP_0170072616 /NCGR_PEP_ID=MMETSP0019_2-20121128/10222_1 /TAXON_ID=98059 /ORGANISM="Dinobryon sp., Strain UTEXLB2267" /LENGTH=607 /DNA_ID=CAMNT_0010281701 /DNA_START=27 /DNA_END=1850 /DNA_ORIENTATION=+